MIKRAACIFIAVCIFLLTLTGLGGCFDYEEMNKLILLTAVGIDREDEGYRVSAQIIVSKGSMVGAAPSMIVKSASGKTVTEAINKIQYYYAEPIYLEHIKIVVLSKEVASESMEKTVEFIGILGPFYNFEVTVAANATAEEVLKAGSFSSHINAMEAAQMISGNNISALPPSVKGYEIMTGKSDYVLPELYLRDNDDTENNNSGEKARKIIITEGGAVMKDGRLVSELDATECSGFLLATKKTLNCNISLDEGEAVTVIENVRKISVCVKDGVATARISVTLKLDGALENKEEAKKQLEERIEQTLNKLYGVIGCDALGLFELFEAHCPSFFEGKEQFEEEIHGIKTEVELSLVYESGKNPLEDKTN